MRCSNMVADSKTEKNLGHNLTVTRLVSLPKTRLRTTTGRYIVKYTLRDRSGCFAGAAVDRAGDAERCPQAL